jgi:hypothetical protein
LTAATAHLEAYKKVAGYEIWVAGFPDT